MTDQAFVSMESPAMSKLIYGLHFFFALNAFGRLNLVVLIK